MLDLPFSSYWHFMGYWHIITFCVLCKVCYCMTSFKDRCIENYWVMIFFLSLWLLNINKVLLKTKQAHCNCFQKWMQISCNNNNNKQLLKKSCWCHKHLHSLFFFVFLRKDIYIPKIHANLLYFFDLRNSRILYIFFFLKLGKTRIFTSHRTTAHF